MANAKNKAPKAKSIPVTERLNKGMVANASSVGRGDSEAKRDGWMNLLTGVGMAATDKRMSTQFKGVTLLTEPELREMYQGDGIVRRIVDMPAKEMMRRGFTLEGDEGGKVQAIFESRNIHRKVTDMIRWARLFGGSIGVLGIEDGGKLNTPVNENSIKRIAFMHVFDRYRVNWTSMDLYSDPNSEKFGQPQFYNVSPIHGNPFVVHESRVIKMDGLPVPDWTRSQNMGWGDNVIQCGYDKIRALESVYAGCESVVEDFIQPVLGIKNLGEMIATNREAEIKTRLDLMDMTRHVLNTLLIDADMETYTKVASSVSGLPDLIDRFSQAVCAVHGIPQSLLMGRSAAGMNATGEGDQSNWYDQIRSEQEDLLSPIYERLCRLAFLSKEVGGKEPESWSIEWNDLYEPSELEEAQARKAEVETADMLVQMGALDPLEVRDSDLVQGRYTLMAGWEPPVEDVPVEPDASVGTDGKTGARGKVER